MFVYIDNFIADLLSGNIEIVYSRAKSLLVYEKEKGLLGSEKQKNKSSLTNELGHALTGYQESKTNPQLHLKYADDCFRYIIWVNTHQVIKRTGLTNKIRDLQKENLQLKEEKDKLQKENFRLNNLNEALHNIMDKLGFERLDSDETDIGEKP